jgi:hypothetical protein
MMIDMQIKDSKVSAVVVIPKTIKDKLERDAELSGTPSKEFMGLILTRYAEWEKFSREIGFATVTRAFLRTVLERVDEKTLTTIAVSTCRGALRDAMLYVTGSASIDGLLKTLDYWLDSTNVAYRRIKKGSVDSYVIQHQLGYKWSLYFSTVVEAILIEVGYHTRDLIMDNESLSFSIVALR